MVHGMMVRFGKASGDAFILDTLVHTCILLLLGIPFDGRDIWQFHLIADDSLDNMWRADPTSFLNLGPDTHRPRCWPWSNDTVLPYERYACIVAYHMYSFNLNLIYHAGHF